jgi:hypothetical protein
VRALRDRDRESHCIGKLGEFARRGFRRGFYANKKRRDREREPRRGSERDRKRWPGEWQRRSGRVDERADDGEAVGEISSGFCDAVDIFLSDVGIRRLSREPPPIGSSVRPLVRLISTDKTYANGY